MPAANREQVQLLAMEKVRAARSESDPRRSGIMSSDGRKTHDRRQGVTATTSARLVLMNNRTELRSRHRAQRGNGKAFALFVCGRRIAAAANIGFSWTTTFHACDRVISRRAPSLLVHQPFHLPSRLAAVILIGFGADRHDLKLLRLGPFRAIPPRRGHSRSAREISVRP